MDELERKELERRCTAVHRAYLTMSVRPGEGWALHGLIRLLRPQTVVEIGRLEGVSGEWMLAAMEDNKKGHLDSVDIQTKRECIPRLAPWEDKGMITVHEFDSHGPQAAALAQKLDPIDFIFIDGDHTPDAVEADCRLWLPHVRGYVLFHDWSFEGVRVGIRRVVDFDKFPQRIITNEFKADAGDHITSHGLMLLYLPDGLSSMPVEAPGKPG